MATGLSQPQLAPSMREFLEAVLNFESSELQLALDRHPVLAVPTPTVKAGSAKIDVAPTSAETLETLFRSIASPSQRRLLKRDGRVRFIYVVEATRPGRQVAAGFRIEAKAVNGRLVRMTCHHLRRYPAQADSLTSATQHE